MRSKKNVLIIFGVIFLLFLVLVPLTFYVLSSKKIEVVNNTKNYSLKYMNSQKFQEDLDEWGFWDKDKVVLEVDGKSHTVDKIKIYTSDSVQPDYQIKQEGQNKVIISSSESVDDNNVLHFKVYMDPGYVASLTEKGLSEGLFFMILQRIYAMSHFEQSKEVTFREFVEIYEDYKEDAQGNLPFVIERSS